MPTTLPPSNVPTLTRLKRMLSLAQLDVDDETLQEILDASVAWIEDTFDTAFDGQLREEKQDGNGSNAITLRRWPATTVRSAIVQLPVLALQRSYLPEELKLYREQQPARLTIFTYKLAAEAAGLHLDQQVYGNLMPKGLPQVVTVTYTYGFPRYDPETDRTSFDSVTTVVGDQRLKSERNRLTQLQQAAIADAAASVLGQLGGLGVGTIQSVSFDGFSQSLNPQAYGPQVEALITRRDELLNARRRGFFASVDPSS